MVVGAELVVTALVVVGAAVLVGVEVNVVGDADVVETAVLVGVALELVGTARVVVGACVVVSCNVELLGGGKLVLWAIVLVETGGSIVGVGAALVVAPALVEGGKREVPGKAVDASQPVVVGASVDQAISVVGTCVVVGTTAFITHSYSPWVMACYNTHRGERKISRICCLPAASHETCLYTRTSRQLGHCGRRRNWEKLLSTKADDKDHFAKAGGTSRCTCWWQQRRLRR